MIRTGLRHPKMAFRHLLIKLLGRKRAHQVLTNIWIARDYVRCSGCRRCEIVCSLFHEGRIWPEASRIRIFMLTPTLEFPQLCAQCPDYPCVIACKFNAMTIDKTKAVLVDKNKCTACGQCIKACPGQIPFIHPKENYAVICNLCGGKPKCAEVCTQGGWGALRVVHETANINHALYARSPEELNQDLLVRQYGTEEEML